MAEDEKTPPLGTKLPPQRHILTDEERRRGTAARSARRRAEPMGPEVEKVQAAPYEPYTEIEINIRGRDGRVPMRSPEGLRIGKIKGAPTRRVSTALGYMSAADRVRLANFLTAFIRHLLAGRYDKPIEQVIAEAQENLK